MTNALILLAATRLLSNDSLLQTTFFDGFVPFKMLALANGVLLLSSLWPFYRGQQNDIQLFWHVSHMGKDELNQLPAAYYFLQAESCRRAQRPAEAKSWIEDGLRQFPANAALESLAAINLADFRRFRDARRAWSLLLKSHCRHSEMRALFLNNIAFLYLLSREPGWLIKADVSSRLSFTHRPEFIPFKGTRGSVLIELGNYQEGLNLLHDALSKHIEPDMQAQNVCYIAIAEARLGNVAESRNYFTLARKLSPNCSLLDREN